VTRNDDDDDDNNNNNNNNNNDNNGDGNNIVQPIMGAPREVARSGQAGGGNFTLHTISKTSVHIPAQ
jgi:hypothetical protein